MFRLSQQDEERARRLHKESIVADALAHALYNGCVFSQNMLKRLDDFSKDASTQLILDEMAIMETQEVVGGSFKEYKERWEASGVDVASVSVGQVTPNVLLDIALWTRKCDSLDWLVKATSVKDIEQAKKEGKRAVIFSFQHNHIGDDLDKVDFFHNLGIRIMELTCQVRNSIGDGQGERTDCGLSAFGTRVVKRMNELGILIDLTHSGHKTMMDTIEISTKPVILSHATCSAVYKSSRSSTDDELKALAQNNGLCSINLVPGFLTSKENRPSLDHFLDHLEHAIEIMGIDKVGIGTDWGSHFKTQDLVDRWNERMTSIYMIPELDYGDVTEGFENWSDCPNITCGLVSRKYSDKEIEGILGGNFLRVFKEVVG